MKISIRMAPFRRLSLLASIATLSVFAIAGLHPAQAVTLSWSAVNEPGVGGAVTSIQVCPSDSAKIVVGGDMLGATYSDDGGQTWKDSFGLQNWECGDSTWKPGSSSEVWLGTMGGPYKSTDGGRNWVSKRAGMTAPETYWGYNVPIQKIVFDPNNSSRLLAFGGSHRAWNNGKSATAKYGSVWESTNSGESWTQKAIIANNGAGVGGDVMEAQFAAGSSTVLFAALRDNGVYKSTDGGATWTAKNSGISNLGTDSLATHPTNASIVWRSGTGKRAVYKSIDGGENWTFSGTGLGFDTNYDHSYRKITVAPSDANVLYVSNSNWQSIYKSRDGGANWTQIAESTKPATPTGLWFQGTWFEIDPSNANTVYVTNSVTIFKSTNGGTSWTDASSKAGSAAGLWKGRGYSGYVSMMVKWNPLNTAQCVLQAMDDGKFMQSDDNLSNWRMHGPTMNTWNGGIDVAFGGSNGSTIYAALGQAGTYEGPAKSTDGGLIWSYITDVGSGDAMAIYTLPSDPSKVWYLRGGRLYYSNNSGGAWSEISVGGNTSLRQIVGDSASTPNIYVTSTTGVYKSTPSNSFTKIFNIENAENVRIALDPSKIDRFYVAAYRYNQYHCGVYRYDAGTITRIGTNEYSYDLAVDPQNPNRVVMVTDHNPGVEVSQATGVWMTENALAASPTWTQQNAGLPMLRGKTIAIHPTNGTIVVGLNGRGFYKANTSGTVAPTPTPTPSPTATPVPNFDGSFETPATQTFAYNATGGPWTFTGNSGIQRNGSAFAAPNAPEGVQTAFLQGISGTNGSFSRSHTFTAGTYTLSFQVAERSYGDAQSFDVFYDTTKIGSFTTTSLNFGLVTTNSFTATDGSHLIRFVGTSTTGDNTAFIDDVKINAVVSTGTGTGLKGEYFSGAAFSPLVKTQTDPQINFSWASNPTNLDSSAMSSVGPDNFSVRWTGQVQAMEDGLYTFSAVADDGIKVWIGDLTTPLLSQNTYNNLIPVTGTKTLVAGQKYDIKIEFREDTSGAVARLFWTRPGGSSVLVPQSQLYPSASTGTAPTLANMGFESPATSTFVYNPAGAGWIFSGAAGNGSGVQKNGSAWGATTAPEGTQTGFLQKSGSLTQSVNFTSAGSYSLVYKAAQRPFNGSNNQSIKLSVDGVVVETFTPSGTNFLSHTSSAFTVSTTGSKALKLEGTVTGIDSTAFIDDVTLVKN